MCHGTFRFHSATSNFIRLTFILSIFAASQAGAGRALAQIPPSQDADMVLNSARKAFNEKLYVAAAGRFREFIAKFPNHKDIPSAKYGLGLTLLESPDRNFTEARDLLQAVAGVKDLKDSGDMSLPFVHYHLGLAIRGQGLVLMEQADAKPASAVQLRLQSQQRFQEAVTPFTEALKGFEKNKVEVPDKTKALPAEIEWAVRCRCDLAELYLRLQKAKEAKELTADFGKNDSLLSRSKYRDQGRYFFAYASFLLRDFAAAQRTLTMLQPFSDINFGNHARYLLARTHHLAEERAEAALHYEGVLADYAKLKKEAAKLAQNSKLDPLDKLTLDALARNPAPDHVAYAAFYLGVLRYEARRFDEALTRFAEFSKSYPQSPLRLEAAIRIGLCQIQMRSYADAIKTLTPLADKEPSLADQVFFLLGKAKAGLGELGNAADYQKSMSEALATYKLALDRSQKLLNPQDPATIQRRAEIMLEIADTQQHLKQHKEAVGGYSQLLKEKVLPEEVLLVRLVVALQMAGDFDESDKQAKLFQEKFPASTLLPSVLFCTAENLYFRAFNKERILTPANLPKESVKQIEETIKNLNHLIEKYPESANIQVRASRSDCAFIVWETWKRPGRRSARFP